MAGPTQIGRYRVERHLGSGGHATVWLARDEGLDALVAVKVLADNWSQNPEIRQRFVEEARILRHLDDERIVRVHDIAELEDGRPYFVMEFADRGSLLERMQRRWSNGEEFTVAEALELSRAIADALAIAHERGVIHRDLKPSNVLFRGPGVAVSGSTPRRSQERLLLADFGIARRLAGTTGQTLAGGTPRYMAPEQAVRETSGADPRSDVYSAAVILYELLAREVPSPAERAALDAQTLPELRRLWPELPTGLEEGLARGLATDPAVRWPSAAAWLEFLAGIDPGGRRASALVPDEAADMPELIRAFCDDTIERLPAGAIRDHLTGIGERVTGPLRIVVTWPDGSAPDWLLGALTSLDRSSIAAEVWTSPIGAELDRDEPDGFVIIGSGREDRDAEINGRLTRHGFLGEANAITIDLAIEEGLQPEGALTGLGPADDASPVLSALHRLIERGRLLSAASAMRAIESTILEDAALSQGARERLEDAFESLVATVPARAQLAVLNDALEGRLRLKPDQVTEVELILAAADPPARLGVPSSASPADLIAAATAGAARWRALALDARATTAGRSAAEVIAAAYESLSWRLTGTPGDRDLPI